MVVKDRWFQIHWTADHIENVYDPSIREAFMHACNTLRLDLADETFPINWLLPVEETDTGHSYQFDEELLILAPERAIAIAQ